MLCGPRVGAGPLPAPHRARLGCKTSLALPQILFALLLLLCLRLVPGSAFEHRDVRSSRMGQSSSQASAALLAQWHILKSCPKICRFPVFPYPAISLPSFFPSAFLWIHLGEFPAIILTFFPINLGSTDRWPGRQSRVRSPHQRPSR